MMEIHVSLDPFDRFTYIYSSSIGTKPRFTMHEKEDASKMNYLSKGCKKIMYSL